MPICPSNNEARGGTPLDIGGTRMTFFTCKMEPERNRWRTGCTLQVRILDHKMKHVSWSSVAQHVRNSPRNRDGTWIILTKLCIQWEDTRCRDKEEMMEVYGKHFIEQMEEHPIIVGSWNWNTTAEAITISAEAMVGRTGEPRRQSQLVRQTDLAGHKSQVVATGETDLPGQKSEVVVAGETDLKSQKMEVVATTLIWGHIRNKSKIDRATFPPRDMENAV